MANDELDDQPIEEETTELRIVRTFDAPRERVFRAFTDPEEMEEWYAPGDMTPRIHILEPEPDGAFALSHLDDDDRYDNEGTFVEVVENERLVHTWRWVNLPDDEETLVTVEFRDVAEGTEVVLTHERVDPEYAEDTSQGWSGILQNLETVL